MRNKITGMIGLILGLFMLYPAFSKLQYSQDGGPTLLPGLLFVILGTYYLFFKKSKSDQSDGAEIAPEDRYKNSKSD